MISPRSALRLRLSLCAALLALDPGIQAAPRGSAASYLSLPPGPEGRIIYYRSFEREKANINIAGLKETFSALPVAEGTRGRAAQAAKGPALDSPALFPHRLLTVSFWWALRAEPDKKSGFGLLRLSNGKGFISHSVRSGLWCGLARSAGAVQVYYLPVIQNINGIYDRDILASLRLGAGEWPHTAVALAAASKAAIYMDRRKVLKARITGRFLGVPGGLTHLTIGSPGSLPVALDEATILNRPLSDDEIATYTLAIRQMHRIKYPLDP